MQRARGSESYLSFRGGLYPSLNNEMKPAASETGDILPKLLYTS